MGARFSSFGWALAALALACPVVANEDEKALELYKHSLEKSSHYNVSALIDQRGPKDDGWERVKVERDRDGRVHKSVLQPLRMQGVESIDNGERWQTILPDDHVILDQESPLKHPDYAEQRIKLAGRNYKFSMEPDTTVADRKAFRIVARPYHSELESKRFFLDQQTLYPLRMESFIGDNVNVEFVTRDIKYPKTLDSDTFELHKPFGMRLIRFDRPLSVLSPILAKKDLGFTPVIPKRLPLGFDIQEMQLNTNPTWHSLVVRLTDGLARATVYEFLASESGVNVMENSSSREVEGVKLLIVSSINEVCRQEILESFAEKINRRSSRTDEAPLEVPTRGLELELNTRM